MELYDVMRTTAAVRRFTEDPLEDDVLYRILDNARFAPSGGNRQGARVVVVRDVATRAALADLGAPAAKRYAAQVAAGETPWQAVHPSAVDEAEVEATEPPDFFIRPFHDAQVVLVVCLDLTAVAAVDQRLDRIGIVGGASVYPFVWNILLAARNEGFGGTISTMAVAAEDQVRALLGIPSEYAVACLVPLGKPAQQPKRLSRNSVEELTRQEHWSGGGLGAS